MKDPLDVDCVYIFGDARVLVAYTSVGKKLGLQEVDGDLIQAIDALKLAASRQCEPGTRYVYVADPHLHPITASFLSPPEPDAPEHTAGVDLCDGCVHEHVCAAREAVAKINATISTCEQHVPLPTESESA